MTGYKVSLGKGGIPQGKVCEELLSSYAHCSKLKSCINPYYVFRGPWPLRPADVGFFVRICCVVVFGMEQLRICRPTPQIPIKPNILQCR